MGIKERLLEDMKEAMRKKDKLRLSTIRMLRSLIKNAEIDKRAELSEDEIYELLSKYAKQRREAIELYERGGRKDLVEKEKAELAIVESYMPQQLSEEQLTVIIKETIQELKANGPKDLGKVMKALMPKIKGRADGSVASRLVKKLLSENS